MTIEVRYIMTAEMLELTGNDGGAISALFQTTGHEVNDVDKFFGYYDPTTARGAPNATVISDMELVKPFN